MTPILERLAELRELAEAATFPNHVGGIEPWCSILVDYDGEAEDSAFIATFDPPTAIALITEVERLRGIVTAVPQWEEMSDGYLVTTGERVRCEFGGETDDAIELTASEAMDGTPVRDLFRGRAVRYYRVALARG